MHAMHLLSSAAVRPKLELKTRPRNTKVGSITVLLTSCLTGLDLSVLQIKTKIVSYHH